MASKNLLVNEEKTEYTTLQKEDQKIRGKREWRLVIKLGSKLGDWEQW